MARVFLSPPYMNGTCERDLMQMVFDSNYIAPCGPMVEAFERVFSVGHGFAMGLATTGATVALTLIFRHLGLMRGDVVICSDLTFIASIAPAVEMGAIPVFVDSEKSSWTMDPVLLKEALVRYPHAKAVIAVDLYGQTCNYDRIAMLCAEVGVPLIIDAAESVGATYRGRPSGTAGIAAVYSFNGNKMITSGGGGMLLSHDVDLMDDVRNLSMQAREPMLWYEHTRTGYNYRMSNVVAAIGLGQYQHVDDAVADKQDVFTRWTQVLAGLPISFMPEAIWGVASRWLTVITLPEGVSPLTCSEALNQVDIEARPLWKPMHMQPVFKDCDCFGGCFSERLFSHGLCLPSGRKLTIETMRRVKEVLVALMDESRMA